MAQGAKRFASIFVGLAGSIYVATSVLGYAHHRPDTPTTAFAVLGTGLVLAAPLVGSLRGKQKFGPTGWELNIDQAEQEVKLGMVRDAREVLPPRKPTKREPAKREPAKREPAPAPAPPPPPALPSPQVRAEQVDGDAKKPSPALIVFAESASREAQQLDARQQALVTATLERLRKEPFTNWEDGSYGMIAAGEGITLVYRPLDKTSPDDPDRYAILQILTEGKGQRWADADSLWQAVKDQFKN